MPKIIGRTPDLSRRTAAGAHRDRLIPPLRGSWYELSAATVRQAWAVVTVTTVGYGDIGPETDAGRVIAMVGIGFVALLTAAAADRFIRSRADAAGLDERLDEIVRRLDAIERQGR